MFGFPSWEESSVSSPQAAGSRELRPARHAERATAVAQSLCASQAIRTAKYCPLTEWLWGMGVAERGQLCLHQATEVIPCEMAQGWMEEEL